MFCSLLFKRREKLQHSVKRNLYLRVEKQHLCVSLSLPRPQSLFVSLFAVIYFDFFTFATFLSLHLCPVFSVLTRPSSHG